MSVNSKCCDLFKVTLVFINGYHDIELIFRLV